LSEELAGIKVRPIHYTISVSIKIDYDTLKELDLMAAFERKKRGTMLRDFLIEKCRTYERYPAFKRFLRQLEEAERHKNELRSKRS
jgi:hypothetical protein